MINFEHGMLVLDRNTTKEDVDAVKEFAEHIRQDERERVIRLLQEPYWHNLRSPGTHEDCKMCETIWLINDINIL